MNKNKTVIFNNYSDDISIKDCIEFTKKIDNVAVRIVDKCMIIYQGGVVRYN